SDWSRRAAYYLYDLWELEDDANANITMTPRAEYVPRKDPRRYGKYKGIVRGHIQNVYVKPHQTRVWKLGVIWGSVDGQEEGTQKKLMRRGARYDL
ncbi:hypothetical protein FRC01_012314, partial [Tulasnella sp. 417]